MEGELIYVTIISCLFGIMGLFILNRNWFKKEQFKLDLANIKAKNNLEINKIKRDMGLIKVKNEIPQEQPTLLSSIASLAPLLKNLDGDQIMELVDKFTGGEIPQLEGGGGDLGSLITNIAAENPDLVKGVIEGIKGKTGNTAGEKPPTPNLF